MVCQWAGHWNAVGRGDSRDGSWAKTILKIPQKIASTSKIDTFRRRFHRQCFHCHHANVINNHPQIHRIWIWASPKGETIWVSKYWHFIEKIGKTTKIFTMSLLVEFIDSKFVLLWWFVIAKDAITATIAGIKATTGAICSKTSVAPNEVVAMLSWKR